MTAGYNALVSYCWLIYGGCGWCRGGGVLVSNNCFLQQNTTASLLELYLMTQCKLCTRMAAAEVEYVIASRMVGREAASVLRGCI